MNSLHVLSIGIREGWTPPPPSRSMVSWRLYQLVFLRVHPEYNALLNITAKSVGNSSIVRARVACFSGYEC